MNQCYAALGSSKKFAKLGNFNATVKGNMMDFYYNLDLGDHRMSMFDVNRKIWEIPAEHSKNEKEYTVFLSDFAFGLFQNRLA